LSQSAKSAVDGSFQFQGLPDGTYTLCAQSPNAGYLDPCRHAAVPLQVTLTAGQPSKNNVVKMTAGSILHVRIQDPQQLLAKTTDRPASAWIPQSTEDLTVGVWGAGVPGLQFYPAYIAGRDSAGMDYQVTIPKDTPLAVYVTSKHLKVVDGTGAALTNNSSRQNFQHNTGDSNPKGFTFSIAGVLP
jgi:hypothetical protein